MKNAKKELENKLFEEYQEVLSASNSRDRIEKLADMPEIISSLEKLENQTIDDITEKAKQKKIKRGGFNKKIFLEKEMSK